MAEPEESEAGDSSLLLDEDNIKGEYEKGEMHSPTVVQTLKQVMRYAYFNFSKTPVFTIFLVVVLFLVLNTLFNV